MASLKTNFQELAFPIEVTDINANIVAIFFSPDRAINYVANDNKLFICERRRNGHYQLYDIADKESETLFQV